jgi:hypothetical protein
MHHLFFSHAEQVYFTLASICSLFSFLLTGFHYYSKSDLAGLIHHRYLISVATMYRRVGVKGYVFSLLAMCVLYAALFARLHWFAVLWFGLAVAALVGTRYILTLIKVSRDKSLLAEADLFMDYDIRVPQIRFKMK